MRNSFVITFLLVRVSEAKNMDEQAFKTIDELVSLLCGLVDGNEHIKKALLLSAIGARIGIEVPVCIIGERSSGKSENTRLILDAYEKSFVIDSSLAKTLWHLASAKDALMYGYFDKSVILFDNYITDIDKKTTLVIKTISNRKTAFQLKGSITPWVTSVTPFKNDEIADRFLILETKPINLDNRRIINSSIINAEINSENYHKRYSEIIEQLKTAFSKLDSEYDVDVSSLERRYDILDFSSRKILMLIDLVRINTIYNRERRSVVDGKLVATDDDVHEIVELMWNCIDEREDSGIKLTTIQYTILECLNDRPQTRYTLFDNIRDLRKIKLSQTAILRALEGLVNLSLIRVNTSVLPYTYMRL